MEELNSILQKTKDKSTQKEQDEILLQPFTYIQQIPGKQFRSELALAFNHWLLIPAEKLAQIGDIVQMLHNSSLLGVPVAHSIYGVASTINAANYALFLALEKVQLLGHPEATKVYTEQLLELHRGQGMEIYWRDSFTCPSESDYKLMTVRKTGGLFMLAIRLMQLFSANKEDYSKLTAILGLYFQIRDDYCNLSLKEYTENKSFAEDLTEGKFGFPVIHAVRSQKQDKQVLHILRQRTHDIEVKKYCISLLEKLGSFQYTRKVLETLDAEARAEVMRLGSNPYMDRLLNKLLSWKTSDSVSITQSNQINHNNVTARNSPNQNTLNCN
ncbi:geranylgeranyl pyrophosphate synthase isoform X2 [Drosophila miranda]|uniref:Geranylgeranyl pyrophosphate synthase isoform X2 n=1 Tax=Drosophila pseudoobscura pseudoobscura TaxID=46245 RepID=A0A0R3P957_DROPS|nr:geranylgeranyl pyrophosphate synthase isoform X2 [Drosophila pseudoobscura]XP_017136577.1 geranylgeranyl pyrophosphate synthase isoform X2 [Drosophila miranda]XP_026848808.1 geranylgeranyl pyrophosphate synthase isoform X2 [Drosophila persimilis]